MKVDGKKVYCPECESEAIVTEEVGLTCKEHIFKCSDCGEEINPADFGVF